MLLRLIAEMLGGLDCSKSYFLGLCQKLLSEKSPNALKLSGFYKLSSGTSTYLGVVLNKCKRRLRKYFEVRNSTLLRRSLWRESKTPERDFLFKSEAVASKFSRGGTLVLGSQGATRIPKEMAGPEAQRFVKNLGLIMGFYTRKYRLAFKRDPLRKNQVG